MEINLYCPKCGCTGTVDSEAVAEEWLAFGCPNGRHAQLMRADKPQPLKHWLKETRRMIHVAIGRGN